MTNHIIIYIVFMTIGALMVLKFFVQKTQMSRKKGLLNFGQWESPVTFFMFILMLIFVFPNWFMVIIGLFFVVLLFLEETIFERYVWINGDKICETRTWWTRKLNINSDLKITKNIQEKGTFKISEEKELEQGLIEVVFESKGKKIKFSTSYIGKEMLGKYLSFVDEIERIKAENTMENIAENN